MKLLYFCVLFGVLFYVSEARKKHHESEEEEEETPGNAAMDRLAMNLAGAFVKSIFPEMDRSGSAPAPNPQQTIAAGSSAQVISNNPNEIRRAPQHQQLFQEASGPAFEALNGFNSRYGAQGGPASSVLSAVNSPNYGLQLPQEFGSSGGGSGGPPLPTALLADMMPTIPNVMNVGSGGVEAINAAKRQQYLLELAKHQREVNDYSAKQMAYLDAQRRYNQQMTDHQAGAALLIQQQQQDFLSKMQNKYAGFDEHDQPKRGNPLTDSEIPDDGFPDLQTGAKVLHRAKSPAKQHAVRTAAAEAFEKAHKEEDNREQYASVKVLKAFFKKHYGIEIPDDGEINKLTPEERETLQMVKDHLVSEAEHGVTEGVLKTMEKFSEKVSPTILPEGDSLDKELASLNDDNDDECIKCKRVSYKKLKGSWTQIYGNPAVMKETYGTILSLLKMSDIDSTRQTADLTDRHASCVGMKIGSAKAGVAPLKFFFRDDGYDEDLHEMSGDFVVLSPKEVKLNTPYMENKMCVVKAGPSEESRFEYIIVADTSGSNKCRNYQVFARNFEDFKLRHFDDVADFMKTEVIDDEALPVAALPKPEQCQDIA
uniref:Uncharacterized protein n=1 Tax=Panagrellus redivivus TaxID=6233 RepID=A0A7E4VH05_PANRE